MRNDSMDRRRVCMLIASVLRMAVMEEKFERRLMAGAVFRDTRLIADTRRIARSRWPLNGWMAALVQPSISSQMRENALLERISYA